MSIKKPPKRSDSSLALQASLCTETAESFKKFHNRIFEAYFQEGKDIGDMQLLLQLASKAGLDARSFEATLSKSNYKARLLGERLEAQQRGVNGVPTFIVGNRLIVGAQPIEVLMAAVTEVLTSK